MHTMNVQKELEVDWDMEYIAALLVQKEVMELPDKLAPARATVHPYVMDFIIIPYSNATGLRGKVMVIKHFQFDVAIPFEDAKALCPSQEVLINFNGAKKGGSRTANLFYATDGWSYGNTFQSSA